MVRSLPTRTEVLPYLTMAVSLSVNNLSALAPTLMATTLATALGPSQLAAHTVLRQVMGFWVQASRGVGGGWGTRGRAAGASQPASQLCL